MWTEDLGDERLWVCPHCAAELDADAVGDACPACHVELADDE